MKFCFWIGSLLSICCWAGDSNIIPGSSFELDEQGRLIKDTFPSGKSVSLTYDTADRIIEVVISGIGTICYDYNGNKLVQVSRKNQENQLIYKHSYEYGPDGTLSLENLIGDLQKSYNKNVGEKCIQIGSPWSQEIYELDAEGRIFQEFTGGGAHEDVYINDGSLQTPLLQYNINGHVIGKASTEGKETREFDSFGNLTKVTTHEQTIVYDYDALRRRVKKSTPNEVETYLYIGMNEIAICNEDGHVKQLRIPGLSPHERFILPIAVEIENTIYAPIHDYRGNLLKLINAESKEVITLPCLDPFGKELSKVAYPTPWIFASKHYDRDSRLVYFGSRYYDPELSQWISPDPLGTLQSEDVYLYCLGNPLLYFDPDGEFAIPLIGLAWGAGAVLTFPAWGTAAACVAAGAAIGWATHEIIEKVKEGKHKDKSHKSEGRESYEPRFSGEELGFDPASSPADGFEWRGAGAPGSKAGAWYNPFTDESLRPDFDHAPPIKPHWDYESPAGDKARIYPDGTWETKK